MVFWMCATLKPQPSVGRLILTELYGLLRSPSSRQLARSLSIGKKGVGCVPPWSGMRDSKFIIVTTTVTSHLQQSATPSQLLCKYSAKLRTHKALSFGECSALIRCQWPSSYAHHPRLSEIECVCSNSHPPA